MPRYFFHVIDGQMLVDDEGTECSDARDMRRQAIVAAGSMLRELGAKAEHELDWHMHVADEDRTVILRLSFSIRETAGRAA